MIVGEIDGEMCRIPAVHEPVVSSFFKSNYEQHACVETFMLRYIM